MQCLVCSRPKDAYFQPFHKNLRFFPEAYGGWESQSNVNQTCGVGCVDPKAVKVYLVANSHCGGRYDLKGLPGLGSELKFKNVRSGLRPLRQENHKYRAGFYLVDHSSSWSLTNSLNLEHQNIKFRIIF